VGAQHTQKPRDFSQALPTRDEFVTCKEQNDTI
jgi:hypothetical protein